MADNILAGITIAQLTRAVAIKTRIAKLERELLAVLGSSSSAPAEGKVRRKNKISAAGRAAIAAAQKARWARVKASKK
jgi:hypothetical protein